MITGIYRADEAHHVVCSDADEVAARLKENWTQVSAEKPVCEHDIDALLSIIPDLHKWDWSACDRLNHRTYCR
eukprot:12405952-Karenia_brevis.AAC.1